MERASSALAAALFCVKGVALRFSIYFTYVTSGLIGCFIFVFLLFFSVHILQISFQDDKQLLIADSPLPR